jgi:hypothetical protein
MGSLCPCVSVRFHVLTLKQLTTFQRNLESCSALYTSGDCNLGSYQSNMKYNLLVHDAQNGTLGIV